MQTEVSVGANTADIDDAALVKRLLEFYSAAAKEDDTKSGSSWAYIFERCHKPLHDAFVAKNFMLSTAMLRNPGSNNLFHGIDNLAILHLDDKKHPQHQADYAVTCLQMLEACARAMGAIRCPNPEGEGKGMFALGVLTSYSSEKTLKKKAGEWTGLIEAHLGVPLQFPNPYAGERGVASPRGIISERTPHALYYAWRILNLASSTKRFALASSPSLPLPHQTLSIIEIGAGLGRAAYYTHELCPSHVRLAYTIVDLPMIVMASAYFLGRTLGEDVVCFQDNKNASATQWTQSAKSTLSAPILFQTPSQFLEEKASCDVVLNADSLTEMTASTALA